MCESIGQGAHYLLAVPYLPPLRTLGYVSCVPIAGSLIAVTLTRHRNAGGPSRPPSVMDYQLKRQIVAEQLRTTAGSGKSDEQVALDCGVGLRTVRRIKSKLRSGGRLEEAPRSGRPRTVQTSGNKEAVPQSIKDNPRQSIRELAK